MFDSEKFLLYLKAKSLEVYWKDKAEAEIFDTTAFVGDLALIDKEGLLIPLGEFLERINLKNQTAPLILSKEILIEKTFLLNDPKQEEVEKEKFLAETALPRENLILKEIKRGNILTLLAIPRAFAQDLKDTLEKAGLKTNLLTAVSLIEGVGDRNSLSPAEVIFILDRLSSFKDINLLSDKHSFLSDKALEKETTPVEFNSSNENNKKIGKLLFLLLAVLLVIGGFVFAALMLGLIKNPFVSDEVQPLSPQETAKETSSKKTVEITGESLQATPSSQLAAKKKEDLKVKVINGTGSPGEAGRVKERLSKIGFREIELANASSYSQSPATIYYSTEVSEEIKSEVEKEIKALFASLEEVTSTEASFDLVITTGK